MRANAVRIFSDGARNGVSTALVLLKIIIPVYAGVTLLAKTPLIGSISNMFSPVMTLFGLPGEAALALVTGVLVGLYASLGALMAIELSPWQMTICAVMLNLCHEMVLETAILKKAGATVVPVLAIRFSTACFAGLALNLIGWSLGIQ